LYVRPPWAEPPPPGGPDLDIVLTPGLAFGTGLHATTRGVLTLLQREPAGGPLTDAGTGSGILSIAAGKLGFAPVRSFDNDPLAVTAARANAGENGVEASVELADVASAPRGWFEGATILANLTSEPVLALISRLAELGVRFPRLIVSGILAGEQEAGVVAAAAEAGLEAAGRLYEAEWVSIDLRPSTALSARGGA
jgi:ribosomal protein L11 methyltransferase